MRHKGSILLIFFALAVLTAPAAEAQLSEEYAGWADGPEGFLLTKKEKKEWEKITTDAEAKKFVDLFWARRNPDPYSQFNVFKAEFESKVRFADANFGYAKRRGSLTERGRVLILLGRPEIRQVRGPAESVTTIDSAAGQAAQVEGGVEYWQYDPDKLPEGFKVKGSRLLFAFYEEKLNSNIFIVDRSDRESFKGMSAINQAPDVYLLHPDLTEVPKPISVAGGAPASASHLAWLEGSGMQFDDAAIVISELGVSDGVSRPLWVHLELPTGAPELDLLAGRVVGSDGEVVSNFEVAAAPLQGQSGAAYHLAFSLSEGSYTVEIVGSAGEEPQVTRNLTADVSAVPDDGTWMSPVWLGTAVSPNPEAKLGDAFTIGGWHLTPISGPELARTSEISYFGFVVRPVLDEAGAVTLKSRVRLKRDGRPFGQPVTFPLESSQVFGDLYMYGNSISLAALPETGPYDFEFEIIESNSDTSIERSVSIEITE